MERTIRVTGKGFVSLKPDLTNISLGFSKVLPTYEEALKAAAEDVNIVKNELAKIGFDKQDLKTTSFDVNLHHESTKDKDGNYKSVFKGYRYSQRLRFSFDANNETLGKVLYTISKLPMSPDFDMYYSVKDTESAKQVLLSNAIKDARKKAEVIAIAANIGLGEVLDINYSWASIEFVGRHYDMCVTNNYACDVAGSLDVDIEPDDITKSDSVTVTYKII